MIAFSDVNLFRKLTGGTQGPALRYHRKVLNKLKFVTEH